MVRIVSGVREREECFREWGRKQWCFLGWMKEDVVLLMVRMKEEEKGVSVFSW